MKKEEKVKNCKKNCYPPCFYLILDLSVSTPFVPRILRPTHTIPELQSPILIETATRLDNAPIKQCVDRSQVIDSTFSHLIPTTGIHRAPNAEDSF